MELKFGKTDWFFLVMCMVVGIIAEESFFRAEIGISYLVFLTAFYALFFYRFRRFSYSHQRFGYLVLICIWLLAGGYFINDNIYFYALNILVIPGLVLFHLVVITSQKSIYWNKPAFITYIFSKLTAALKYNFFFASFIGRFLKQGIEESKFQVWKKVGIGILISVPVLFVVLMLLMSADTQFERMMGDIPQWFEVLDGEIIGRIFVVLFFTFAFFSFLQTLIQKQINAVIQNADKQWFKLDAIMTSTFLVLINAVYVLFTVVQFKYFFSGTLLGDFTYAEYARKGFFELLFVTLINLTITILVLTFADRSAGFIKRFMQVMLTTLVFASAVLLSSAFLRLGMYEEAYGFTFIRVMAHSFMIFLAVIFMYTFIKIWIEKLSLFHFYFISGLLYYTLMNVINVEQIIVTKNIERYEQSGKIDIHYLNSLSSTGILGLIQLYEKNPQLPDLGNILFDRKNEANLNNIPWQSYNLKSMQANEELKKLHLE
ncbi:DUF4173 domain-containing protein [Neobacillus niacini]|uniref:DUF4153 domain-containing protein n=1 Tax=Neobacillus niacini TaxID=86668 RepID=UPI00052FCFA4|nr:DUF4173 domain-containing protein [Neobacillus niacini]KGM45945.1 hypothetical protein NP83_03000 [Neobacillus niacini]MEC1521246.1 DUF4173 domain-containing protein [Neobacillus niacini]